MELYNVTKVTAAAAAVNAGEHDKRPMISPVPALPSQCQAQAPLLAMPWCNSGLWIMEGK